jgi:hypothetical protein
VRHFFKKLWTINGILLFVAFIFIIILIGQEVFENGRQYETPKVIVGEELEKAKRLGLILQGVTFNYPTLVHQTNGYLLPVSTRLYKNPIHKQGGYDSDGYPVVATEYNAVNVIFLDSALQPQRILLDRKGFISTFQYPEPPRKDEKWFRPKNITYEIAFVDSNGDKVIDSEDNTDLYISSLDGADLTQVTRGTDVLSYRFLDTNRILIKYCDYSEEIDDEHRPQFFSLYFIDQKRLVKLSSLHESIEKVESMITQ